MLIYLLKNQITNERYIGKTKHDTVLNRWYCHRWSARNGSSTRLHRAINKYGESTFSTEILESGVRSKIQLNERERYWISHLQPEYNLTEGGDGGNTGGHIGRTWKCSNTARENYKKAHITHKKSYELAVQRVIPKISSGNNYQSTNFIHTPWGVFHTYRDAVASAKHEKEKGNTNVILDGDTIRSYCKGKQLNPNGKRTPKEWRGKHTFDLGFYLEAKEDNKL